MTTLGYWILYTNSLNVLSADQLGDTHHIGLFGQWSMMLRNKLYKSMYVRLHYQVRTTEYQIDYCEYHTDMTYLTCTTLNKWEDWRHKPTNWEAPTSFYLSS